MLTSGHITKILRILCMTSGNLISVNEICALLRYYVKQNDSLLPTIRDNLSVTSSLYP